jgi:Tfp pilus assembly protein PilE
MFSNSKILKSIFKDSSGFTLTEILVIVLIIAVLTAIAYPLYTRTINKSRVVEAVNLFEIVRTKQIANYARNGTYYENFEDMGQLTNNKEAEKVDESDKNILRVKDYEIELNTAQECLTAKYEKGGVFFEISASYSKAGLGCSDNDSGLCTSFGNVVGTAKEVCSCGDKSCTGGFTLNGDTCACECAPGLCNKGTTCKPKTQEQATKIECSLFYKTYGGGRTYVGGEATRPCDASCKTNVPDGSGGGDCDGWNLSECCYTGAKPNPEEACGRCNKGIKKKTVTCGPGGYEGKWTSGDWGECIESDGVCTPGDTSTISNGTITCSDECAWSEPTCKKWYHLENTACVSDCSDRTYYVLTTSGSCSESEDTIHIISQPGGCIMYQYCDAALRKVCQKRECT